MGTKHNSYQAGADQKLRCETYPKLGKYSTDNCSSFLIPMKDGRDSGNFQKDQGLDGQGSGTNVYYKDFTTVCPTQGPISCMQLIRARSFPPVFHEWFIETFPEPSAWLTSRLAYGRTAAVMSMVGFILGFVLVSIYLITSANRLFVIEGLATGTVKTSCWTIIQAMWFMSTSTVYLRRFVHQRFSMPYEIILKYIVGENARNSGACPFPSYSEHH